MRVKELIKYLLDCPLSDEVVLRPTSVQQKGCKLSGYWRKLEPNHITSGQGIIILELQEYEPCQSPP